MIGRNRDINLDIKRYRVILGEKRPSANPPMSGSEYQYRKLGNRKKRTFLLCAKADILFSVDIMAFASNKSVGLEIVECDVLAEQNQGV